MFEITLITVGKLKEKFYQAAVEEYVKRLRGYCKLNIVELAECRLADSPSQAEIDAALEKRSCSHSGENTKGLLVLYFYT